MGLLVLLRLISGDCARLSFGGPEPDAALPHAERMRQILDNYPARRDEVWDLRLDPILTETKAVLSSPDPGPRLIPAILARGQTGWPVDSNLVQRYLTHPDRDVRLAAIRSLGQTGDPSSIPLLRQFLESDDRALRRAAIVALGGFADASLPAHLESAAGQDPDLMDVARQSRKKIDALLSKDPEAIVEAWIETPEYEDLVPAIRGIQQQLLRVLADHGRSADARQHAARLLVLGKVAAAPRRLAAILADQSEPLELRRLAAFGMGRGRFKPGVPLLIETLDEDQPILQEAAIVALGETGAADAFDPLVAHWSMQQGGMRKPIRTALWRLCPMPGQPELSRLLRASVPMPIGSAYLIDDELRLYESYDPGLVGGYLESTNADARRDAILLLAFYGTTADIPRLQEASRTDADPVNRDLARLAEQRLSVSPGADR